MKRLLTYGLALACVCGAYAQQPLVYPLDNAALGFDTYKDATYYYSGGNTYNLRNFAISKSDSIVDFKVSPDGKSLAVIAVDKKVKKGSVSSYNLWECNNKISTTKDLSYGPVCICYDATARRLCVAGKDRAIRQLDVNTMQELSKSFVGFVPTSLISSSTNLVAAINGKSVNVRKISDMSQVAQLSYNAQVNSVAFSNDGHQMAVLTSKGTLTIYETDKFKEVKKIDALGLAIDCAFNADGKHIAVVTGANSIAIINLLKNDHREIIETNGSGVSFVRFVVDQSTGIPYLVYNTTGYVNYREMSHLSPLRTQLITDQRQEKMAVWEQMRPGESEEEYKLRVNAQTRLAQMQSLEQEIVNQLAFDALAMPQMQSNRYNPEYHLLSISLNNGLNDIFLEVPASEVADFKQNGNLDFQNLRYGVDAQDEFILLYADVNNKANGKTYVYDNLEGQFIDLIADEATFAPIEIIEQALSEESMLYGLTENIMTNAKAQNILTDHTRIDVTTALLNEKTDSGENVRNYEVSVTYTVDEDYSAKEDYGIGKYEIKDSPAAMAMIDIVQKAFESEFSKYLVPGKPVCITVYGSADASQIKSRIPYNGCYGYFENDTIVCNGEPTTVSITKAVRRIVNQDANAQSTYKIWPNMGGGSSGSSTTTTVVTGGGISTDKQLAFLRAVGIDKAIFSLLPQLEQMDTKVKYDINVADKPSSECRKVGVKFVFVDVF